MSTEWRGGGTAGAVAIVVLSLLAGCGPGRAGGGVTPGAQAWTPLVGDRFTLAFASCLKGHPRRSLYDELAAADPDVLVLLGDNVYADVPVAPRGPADFAADYAKLAGTPGWRAVTAGRPVFATWDDHDYGVNDGGAGYGLKRVARAAMLDFFGVPPVDPRRTRDGVYGAWTFGPPGRRTQLILLDTRWSRGPLTRDPAGRPRGRGPYVPDAASGSAMLGEAQWVWLERRLREPAELRLIGSSVQVVADEHGWETWGNLPRERARLYRLIADTHAAGVVFITGDRHLAELSCLPAGDNDDGPAGRPPYPLYDFTASGFDQKPAAVDEPNAHRVSEVYRGPNFGRVSVDWTCEPPVVGFRAIGAGGRTLIDHRVLLSDLRAP